MSPTDSQEYALELLRLNPCIFAHQIIRRRAQYLGIEQVPRHATGSDVDLSQRRYRAEQALSKIRAEFWAVASAESESRLAAQNFEGLPDLAASAARLARAAQASAEFSRLSADRRASQAFVEALRQIVVLPPAEAGHIRQRQEQMFSGSSALWTAKRTVRLIAKKYPQIYALEEEWLDHVASLRRSRKRPSPREKQARKGYNSHLIWIAVIIAFNILRMLIRK